MENWEIHMAVQRGDTRFTQKWLLSGEAVNINALFRGETLLCTAIKQNHPHIVNILLNHGADPNLKSKEEGRNEPPLMTATRLKKFDAVRLLLENGADIHGNNFYGVDAIYQAVKENAFEILECLLNNIPHGTSPHVEMNCCPLILSMEHAPSHQPKKQCLLMLIKNNYLCNCFRRSGHRADVVFRKELERNRRESDPDILRWVYLSQGIRMVYPNDEEKNNRSASIISPLRLNLMNLTRIKIRQCISLTAFQLKKNFAAQVCQLPLPRKLSSDFLLMQDVS